MSLLQNASIGSLNSTPWFLVVTKESGDAVLEGMSLPLRFHRAGRYPSFGLRLSGVDADGLAIEEAIMHRCRQCGSADVWAADRRLAGATAAQGAVGHVVPLP